MRTLAPLLAVLAVATAYGFWYRINRGKIVVKTQPKSLISRDEIGIDFGSRVTLVQFSSAFCSPCRATRALLTDITADMPDVVHVDIDAESHLELVRKLDIRSTPTTLILDSDGIEVGRAVGAPKREQVLTALANVH